MHETLKELSAELAVLHESLERAEVIERQLPTYLREIEAERDEAITERNQLRAQLETASGNARLYADKCTALEGEVERVRADRDVAQRNWDLTQKRATKWAQESTAATARAEAAESTVDGLRRALEDERSPLRLCNPSCQEGTVTRCMCRHCVDGRSKAALAASPDEHERRIKAEALRGLKNMSVRKLDGHYVVFLGHIEAEAELLEKEAVVLDAMETEENG